ncbi:hypothetical protein AMTRI_Chr02g217070 [Amborella trichopoda]
MNSTPNHTDLLPFHCPPLPHTITLSERTSAEQLFATARPPFATAGPPFATAGPPFATAGLPFSNAGPPFSICRSLTVGPNFTQCRSTTARPHLHGAEAPYFGGIEEREAWVR